MAEREPATGALFEAIRRGNLDETREARVRTPHSRMRAALCLLRTCVRGEVDRERAAVLMSPVKTFLFGDGWAMAWYLIHYLLLAPLWGFYTYFRDYKPGAGPQGGEAIVAFMILYVLAIAAVAVINGVVCAVAAEAVWWKRFLLWPLGLAAITACSGIFALGVIMDFASASNGTSARVTMGVGVAVYAALFLGANFWALAKVRG